jgi:hypothetical protein
MVNLLQKCLITLILKINCLRSVALNSARPFRIRIVAERNRSFSINDFHEPFVLIKKIGLKNKYLYIYIFIFSNTE